MSKVYYINSVYKITEGVLAGYVGKLVAYDATTSDASIEVEQGVVVCTKGDSIDLIQKKPTTPRKKKFMVSHKFTSDTIIFNVPKGQSKEDVDRLLEALDCGDSVDINGVNYGWQSQAGLPIVLGIVDAASKEEAIDMFEYNPHTLEAYELV